MKTTTKILCVTLALILFSCTNEDIIDESAAPVSTVPESTIPNTSNQRTTSTSTLKIWNFDNLNEWVDATQVGVPNYFIDNGNLNISTHANTYDRTKIKSIASYTTGTYTWRVYVPAMGVGDQASIGAFLYNNDTHELDFEIGYGKQSERESLNALSDELIVYMTSQANPVQTYRKTIKREQWYTLSIQLTLVNRNYHAKWIINNEVLGSTPLNYGTKFKFNIFCSMENLSFIGDHIPFSDNYALFDFCGIQIILKSKIPNSCKMEFGIFSFENYLKLQFESFFRIVVTKQFYRVFQCFYLTVFETRCFFNEK